MGNEDPEQVDAAEEEALRLPSLGFGRRRRKKDEPDAEPVVEETSDTGAEVTAAQPVVASPEPEPEPEPVPEPVPAPAVRAEPEPSREQPAAEAPDPEQAREPISKMVSDFFRRPADEKPTQVEEPVPSRGGWSTMTGAEAEDSAVASESRERSGRSSVALPSISLGGRSERLAAGVVGVLAGLLLVAGTVLAMGGCELVRGTSTCGGGPGVLLAVAVVVVTTLVGAAALRVVGVPYSGTTSFLGVGLVVVITLLFLLGVVYSVLMVAVIPLLTGAGFVLAHGLVPSFSEPYSRDWR